MDSDTDTDLDSDVRLEEKPAKSGHIELEEPEMEDTEEVPEELGDGKGSPVEEDEDIGELFKKLKESYDPSRCLLCILCTYLSVLLVALP